MVWGNPISLTRSGSSALSRRVHSWTPRRLSVAASEPLMSAPFFHRSGADCGDRMSFAVEMIVPQKAVDDVGQVAKAATTFLRYELELG